MSRNRVKRSKAKRKIAVITTSRADYAHLHWLLHDLNRHPAIDLHVVALGPHLSPEFGHTGKQIARMGNFSSVECLLSSDTDVGMAKTLGVATLGLAETLGQLRPDLILLVADRYEMLAPACVALTLRIPIAHIEGGEITTGAIDDAVRNALTKMAHLHFACTRRARERILAMGEEPWRVTFSGSLSLDDLRRSNLLSKSQVEKKLGISLAGTTLLAIYHPVTMMDNSTKEAEEFFAALEHVRHPVFFVYPNADAGSRRIIRMAEKFVRNHPSSRLFINLDHITYLSLLKNVGVLLGNSSGGVIESTSLEVPTLNIGIRQQGREHAANVIDVPAAKNKIIAALKRALSPEFRGNCRGLESPYGDGRASHRIVQKLATTPPGPKLLFKRSQ
jgi:UDP-N-acetylglucosamine 2-epimerase (non-hydrolysing)/GDP/UDP-N,N'-diacetylbacillosamine 2-epimerase (hydrolysing)